MPRLADDYRPKSWSEIIGQDRALAVIERLRKRGLSGRAYFLAGPKGSGKNSIASLLAAEVADEWGLTHLNAKALNQEMIDRIELDKRRRPFGKGICYVVDEVHILRNEIVTQLLNVCQDMPPWLTMIFTTTAEAKANLFDDKTDASPLLERCEELPMNQRGLAEAFAAQLVKVARQEGLLNGHPDEWYLPRAVRCIKEHRNSLRAGYVAVEHGYLTATEEGGGHE
jgi:DNA polymerase-3 subunit gamma/tau